ncbi:MAG: TonB-dependent receptor [Bacteroidales bacterium]|nr:TonB-dependent receptor [Bacteroidales bacterium]
MKNFIIIILFYFISNFSNCQLITIKDKINLQPIENVYVFINESLIGHTNIKGQIKIKAELNDLIRFEHISYETVSKEYKEIVSNKNILFLIPKTNLLHEVTIASTRFESNKNNVAQTNIIIDKALINSLQAQTSADLLSNSGLAFVQKSQLGGGSPIIRGFEANKILLVVDGIRMNNAIYRGGHLQNIITVDAWSLNKAEILEGSSSVMYGSDALGGTIYLETIKPLLNDTNVFTSKGNVMLKTSTANKEKMGHVDINIANHRIASLTSISYAFFDDLRQGNNRNPFYGDWGKRWFYVKRINNKDSVFINNDPNLQIGAGYSQYDLLQKVLFKVNNNLQLLGNVQFSNSSNISRYDRLTQMSGTLPKYAEWYYGPQRRLLAYLKIEYHKKNMLFDDLRLVPAYQNIEESRHDRKFNKNNLNHRIENVDIFSLNIDFRKNFNEQLWIYGLEFSNEKIRSNAFTENILDHTTSNLDTRYPDGGSIMNRNSVFINHQWNLFDKVFFSEGLRYNFSLLESKFIDTTFYHFPFNEISQQNQAITGSIGVVFKTSDFLKFHLNYASGYRTPNVDDLSKIFESVPGNVIMPNENLKPEKTHTFDIGYQLLFNSHFSWYNNAFYTIYKDAITTEPGKFNGLDSILYNGQMSQVILNVNKTKAYLYGISSNLLIQLNTSLNFIGNVCYTYGRIKTDSTDYPLDHIPPVFGKIGFQYKKQRLSTEINMLFNGWKFIKDYNMYGEDNFVYATSYGMPAWITFNVYGLYQIHTNLQVNAAIENILDQNYRVFASNISAPGRNFKIGLKFIW